jgi:hypothetical protein
MMTNTQVQDVAAKQEAAIYYLTRLAQQGVRLDMPFAQKRKVIELLVDRIIIDAIEKWYRIEGVIRGTAAFGGEGTPGESSGSLPQSENFILPSTRRHHENQFEQFKLRLVLPQSPVASILS